MRSRTTIWLRRTAGMAVVALAVAIPATLLIRGEAGVAPEEAGEPVAVVLQELDAPARVDRGLRVGYQLPKGWKRDKADRTLTLRSRDGAVLVAVAAPAPAGEAGRVRRDLVREIRTAYRRVDVRPGGRQRIGGLDARTSLISARHPGGGQIRLLLAVAEGKQRTYVVEVFTAADAKPRRIVQAQTALNALELRG